MNVEFSGRPNASRSFGPVPRYHGQGRRRLAPRPSASSGPASPIKKPTFSNLKGSYGILCLLLTVLAAIPLQIYPRHAEASDLEKSGTVEISQTQIAFIFSANLGGGSLSYGGATYDFTVGGLGVGGVGVSKIEAEGEVYNMERLSDFEGAYGQARAGFALGDVSAGDLWLENPAGVYMRLRAKREGLALAIGADAVYIKLK